MEKEDFLQIFKSGFHKLTLLKVKKIGEEKNESNRIIGDYLGLFEFVPPEQVFMSEEDFDYDFLKRLLKEFDKEASNVIVRQYTRRILKNSKTLKQTIVKYVFDIVPKNIVAFRFYRKTKTMRVVVKGYCLKR